MIKTLDKAEILRYLGYPAGKTPDEKTAAAIARCEKQLIASARPKYIAKAFRIAPCDAGIQIADSDVVLSGSAISGHLEGCTHCVIMAATLGITADRTIRTSQLTDMTDGVITNACATAYIEAFCDMAEAEINEKYGHCNFRFSPGYGDLPITLQKELLNLLDAERKIGLCVNASNLLIPAKSVTAILGITQKPCTTNKCDRCPNKERCAFCRNEQ